MGSWQSNDKTSYFEIKHDIEQVAWFFKKYPIEKQEYKVLYDEDLKNSTLKNYNEFLPKTFEEFWEEIEEIIKNSENIKTTKKPINKFWGTNYKNFKVSDNSKLKHSYLLILHYSFMNLVLNKIYFCNKYLSQTKNINL